MTINQDGYVAKSEDDFSELKSLHGHFCKIQSESVFSNMDAATFSAAYYDERSLVQKRLDKTEDAMIVLLNIGGLITLVVGLIMQENYGFGKLASSYTGYIVMLAGLLVSGIGAFIFRLNKADKSQIRAATRARMLELGK